MSLNEPTITVHGNLVDRPEIRFTSSGHAVTELRVAQNPRFRGSDGEWGDGETVFLTVRVWRDVAENVADSLSKGDRITVVGRLRRRTWEDKETGEKRWRDEIEADDVAVSLNRQRVRVAKVSREPAAEPVEPAGTGDGS